MKFQYKTVLLSFCLMASAMPIFAGSESEQTTEVRSLPTVTIAEATKREIVLRVPISGDVTAVQEVLVYPNVSGYRIKTLNVEVGDTVTEGQVLATLDDATLSAQLAQAQAARDQAFSELERAKKLRKAGTISQESFDKLNSAAINSQSQLDIVMNNHGGAQVLAPVAGIISARNGQIGSISSAGGEPIYKIIQDGKVEVLTQATETSLSQISVGEVAIMDLASGDVINGTVKLIAPIVDPKTRLSNVWIKLEDNANPPAGMFVSGWIIIDKHEGIAVPSTAVLADRVGDYVLVVKDGVVEKRYVKAGAIWENVREVLEGLSVGEMVIERAGAFFSTGDEVETVMSGTKEEPKS